MFDLILKKLENASANHDYYDRIKLICQQVDSVSFMLTHSKGYIHIEKI